jgi:hypothetical protein
MGKISDSIEMVANLELSLAATVRVPISQFFCQAH